MGTIVAILFLSFALQFIPFLALGWFLRGWRPYFMSLVGMVLFVFVLHAVPFHWLTFIIGYFLGVGLYAQGGKLRTGKSTEELLSGSAKSEEA